MIIDLITLFPDMFNALHYGIVGRAQQQRQLILNYFQLRDYSSHADGRIDDRPYGGGPGMVIQYEPLANAITAAKKNDATPTQLIYLSPQGKPLEQADLVQLIKKPRLTLLCGRYEGIDERIIEEFVDQEYSVGDYVVSGGELPAMILIDALTRLIPGTVGDEQSVQQDSFSNGLLDYPHYTRPETIAGHRVPSVLLSGDHRAIADWRLKQSLTKTWQKRPDLLKRRVLSKHEHALLDEIKNIED